MNCYILQTSLLWEKWKLKVTPLQPFQKKVYFEEVKVKNCELLLVFVLHPMNCYILQKSLLWEKCKLKVTSLQPFQKKTTLMKWKSSLEKVNFEKNENLKLHCYSSLSKVFFGESESEKLWTSADVCLKPDSNSTRLPQSRSRTTKRKKASSIKFLQKLILILWSSETPLKDFNVVQKYSLNISVEGPAAN